MARDNLTPTEIIEQFPQLQNKFGWTSSDIGRLFTMGLLTGFEVKSKGQKYIDPDSVKALINFANEVLNRKKIAV